MSKEKIQELIEMERQGKGKQYELFWGGPFSNFWIKPFEVEGVEYICVEQYMMSQKAELFGDENIARRIMRETDQKKMKSLGRKVCNFDGELWDQEKEKIVKKGLRAKFTQNEGLKRELINTGDKVLVEASPFDVIWGIGYDKHHPNSKKASLWNGLNLLGFLLTELRAEIK